MFFGGTTPTLRLGGLGARAPGLPARQETGMTHATAPTTPDPAIPGADHDAARPIWRAAVATVADKARQALPQCHSRIERAVALVLAGAVEIFPDGTARVASQSESETTYRVVNGQCPCPDGSKAPQGLCKHRLAHQIARQALALAEPDPADAPPPAPPPATPPPPASPGTRGTHATSPTPPQLIADEVEKADRACQAAVAQTLPVYWGFLTFLSQRKRVGGTKDHPVYATIRLPYLGVDGRLQMAHDEHRAHGELLTIHTEFVREPDSGQLLCRALVTSPLRGTATAHARVFVHGSGVDASNPCENGETSAVGRALGFLGYGLYGTGIASAEEVLQAQAAREAQDAPDDTSASDTPAPADIPRSGQGKPPSERQRALIRTLLQEQGASEDTITTRLAAVATRHDASRLIDDLRAQTAYAVCPAHTTGGLSYGSHE